MSIGNFEFKIEALKWIRDSDLKTQVSELTVGTV